MEMQEMQNSKIIWKENKVEWTNSALKLTTKLQQTTNVKKGKWILQCNRIKSPDISPYIHGQKLKRVPRSSNREIIAFSIASCQENWIDACKKIKL